MNSSHVFRGIALLCTISTAAFAAEQRSATFRVDHSLRVKEIPAGTELMRVWFWLPDDDEAQKVLDLTIADAPTGFRITRDHENGHRYLYAEVKNPGEALTLATKFTILREALGGALDARKAGALTDAHRAEFAEYLVKDTPNMETTARIAELAREVCGNETNVLQQARLIYDYVADHSDHYSLPGAPKSSGKGSADYCLDMKGGGCTDQHALFIAMARARGIPTRLQFGSRLAAKNEGKDFDPGYRCWVQYFAPNYGWVSADVSAGDTTPAEREKFVTGLDFRRIRFLEGRNLELNPPQTGARVNLMIGAYVEVDGKPHAAFERQMRFEEIKEVAARADAATDPAPTAGPPARSPAPGQTPKS